MTEPARPSSVLPTPPPDAGPLALRTLGALALTGDVDAERAAAVADLNARPRAMAVGPVSRELLTDELWGDRDPERARHSLADALSAIRRAFGRDSVSQRSPQLAFRPEARLVVDAVEFQRAVGAGRDADALALYRGDFLEGVFIDRAPRFDQWAMQRRFALREQFVGLAARECRRLAAAGAHEAVAALALRWQAAAPDDPAPTRAWLDALAAPGTASALRRALDAWGEHVRALAREDETPDDALVDFVGTLQARYDAMPPVSAPAQPPLPPRRTPPPATGTGMAAAPGDARVAAASTPTSRPAAPATSRPVASTRHAAWIGAIVVGVFTVTAFVVTRGRGTTGPPPWIVVADAETAGVDSGTVGAFALASRTALESDGSVFVLPEKRALELAQLSAPEARRLDVAVAPAVARRSGAVAIVVPVLMQSGQRLRAAMRIIDPDAGTDVVQGTDVPPDSLLTALDALVARVRGRLPVRARRAAPPLPDVATRSLPALAAYAAAVRHQEDLRYTAALAGYREAIALDSSFAVAYAALGNLLHVLNRPLAGDSALRQAMARLDGVPPHDRVRIQATAAVARSQYEVAIGALLGWLSQHPEDRPLRARLANVYMRAGNLEASAREWRRIVAEDSLDADAWIDLSKALGHHPATLDSAARALERGLAIQPRRLDDVFTVQSLGNVLVLSGRPDSAASVFRRLTTRDSSLAGRGYRWLGMLALWQGTPTLAAAELARAIDRQQREPLSTLRTLWVSVHANQMRGDTAATRRALDALAAVAVHPEVAEPRALWFAGTLLARAGRVRDAQRVLDHLRSRMLKEVRPHQASERLLGAEIAGARGEFRTALALAREGAGYDRFILSLEGLALAHLRVGAPDSAVAALRMIEQEIPSFSWEGSVIRRFVGAPLATSLLAAGDTLGARQVRDALRRQLPKAEPAALAWVAGTGFLGLPATSGRPAP